MQTVGEALEEATRQLEGVSESPRADAEFLLAQAMGVTRGNLPALRGKELPDKPGACFRAFVERRLAHEPVAYILGEWEFFSIPIRVRRPMLVPRPETEHLVEAVLEHVHGCTGNFARILEIGTGTGCVAIAIAANAAGARIVATDVNAQAIALARENAERAGVAGRIEFREGSLFEPIGSDEIPFDAICSNPPYVEAGAFEKLSPGIRLYEDRAALVAGPDGLAVIRELVGQAGRWLAPRGLLAFEIGAGQHDAVLALLRAAGYVTPGVRNDLAGIPRIAYGWKAA